MDERLIAELLLEIKKLNALLQKQQPSIASEDNVEWATATDAYEALKAAGIKSPWHLKRLRQEGVFSEARGEIRNVSKGSSRPHWQYNIAKCRPAIKAYFDRISA